MTRIFAAMAFAAVAALAAPVASPAEFSVSLGLGEPGYYGRIEPGQYGPPGVINSRPLTISKARRGESREPLYLRVPAKHFRDWRRYCARWDACGRAVFFIRDDWYDNVYSPRYRDDHRNDRRDESDERRDNDERNDRYDRDRSERDRSDRERDADRRDDGRRR